MQTIGVIGCGYWGPNLIRNFNAHSDCVVKTVCDADQKRLQHMQSLYPAIGVTTSVEEIYADDAIDAVVVATPVSSHFSLALQALQAGKNVFVEKPMAASADECRQLNRCAADQNLKIMVGHTFLYSAPVRKVKEIINSGELGEILYISARRLNLGLFQKDINVAWDLAPHDISIILYICEYLPESVSCQGRAHVTQGIEDITNITLNFTNGKFATIQSSWLDPFKVREMKFVGTRKMLVYDDNEPLEKIKVYDKSVEVPPHYDTFAEFHYSYHYGDMYSPYIQQTEPLKVESRQFLDCISGTAESPSSGHEGLQVVQILECASDSLRNNGVAVPLTA